MPTLNEIFSMALPTGASDLHLSVGIPPVCRREGSLTALPLPALTEEDTERFSRELLGEENFRELVRYGEYDMSYTPDAFNIRMRINIYRERGRFCVAIRALRQQIPSFEDLGLPVHTMESLCRLNQGLVLVTGQTGMGKTTTISAMIDWINRRFSRHIITIEDPIEYYHEHQHSIIHQRETGGDTRSFHTALRSALRQDPDIIFVGEMRDLESISTALTAAETGHLVFSTLHTNSASKAIDRIIDVFPNHQQPQVRAQLSLVMRGIIAQQLIPSASGGRRELALEVLLSTSAVRNLIRENHVAQIPNAILTSASVGMCAMEASLCAMVREGRITEEDGLSYSPNPDLFRQAMQRRVGVGY